jgi:putative salt-induced outer membrane protein YdiY
MGIRHLRILCVVATTSLVLSDVAVAQAQETKAPPPVYTGNVGGGIALTGGNTDTKNFNLTASLVRDPKTRNVVKGSANYLRGDQNDIITLDRTGFNLRDEYTLTGRTFVFGQMDYLRDKFKQIIFLWVPAGGIGYKFINTDKTLFILDGAVGGYLEKNPGLKSSKSGSLTPGQRFQYKLSPKSSITESVSTIFKTKDFEDSLTNFSAGVTTSLVGNLELKLEFIDSYKNKPVKATLKKNDTAFVTAFVVKF